MVFDLSLLSLSSELHLAILSCWVILGGVFFFQVTIAWLDFWFLVFDIQRLCTESNILTISDICLAFESKKKKIENFKHFWLSVML